MRRNKEARNGKVLQHDRIRRDALARELKKRDLNKTRASLMLGYGSTYLHNAMTRGKLPATAIKLLESELNIREDDIRKREPEKEAPKEEPKTAGEVIPPKEIATAIEYGVTESLEYVIEKYGVNIIIKALEVFASEYAIYKVGGVMTFRRREDMRNEEN